jgi:hypothetical protein
MKIRITENMFRIRLSDSDIRQINTGQPLSISLPMGTQDFTIVLQSGHNPIAYTDHKITIEIEKSTLTYWILSKENTLKQPIIYQNNRTLNLIVEKDYFGT